VTTQQHGRARGLEPTTAIDKGIAHAAQPTRITLAADERLVSDR
jgi:hypothetical protein